MAKPRRSGRLAPISRRESHRALAFTSFIDQRSPHLLICCRPGAAGVAGMVYELRTNPFDFEVSGKLT
jgi:hypothetical protein